jgi:adenine-specific DNA-methyltransferase
MQLNAAEEFDDPVQFMLVQLDDELDEPRGEETTHAEVCERRLQLAIDQIAENHDIPASTPWLGFDKYTLGDSRFDRWGQPDSESEAKAALERYASDGQRAVDLSVAGAALIETQLLLGFSLSATVTELEDRAYHLSEDDRDAFVTFAESVTYDSLTEYDLPAETQYVCLDGSLSDTDKERLNRELTLQTI